MAGPPLERLPVVRCSGATASEIGRSHGEQLRDRIASALEYYLRTFQKLGLGPDAVRQWGEGYRREIGLHAPALAEEIDAIAAGAGRSSWELFALNARSEIIAHGAARLGKAPPAECTAVYCPMSGLLAQNWDWDVDIESLPVLLLLPRRGKLPSVLTMTEPGMVAKVGLNDSGLGVCLNFIPGSRAPDEPIGLPVHCLLRLALSCGSLAEAHAALRDVPRHCSCHILLADGAMRYRMLEFSGAALECAGADSSVHQSSEEVPIEGAEWQLMPPRVVAHTNHYLHPRLEALTTTFTARTRERQQRVTELAGQAEESPGAAGDDLRLVKQILGDRDGAPKSILYRHKAIATICSVVMDLRSCMMHVTRGPAMEQNYVPVRLLSSGL